LGLKVGLGRGKGWGRWIATSLDQLPENGRGPDHGAELIKKEETGGVKKKKEKENPKSSENISLGGGGEEIGRRM